MSVAEIAKELSERINLPDFFLTLAGVLLFGRWLLKTSLGRKALIDSVPRRNNMPFYTPFIPLFIWFGAVSTAVLVAAKWLPELPDWEMAFVDNALLCIGAIGVTTIIIFLARAHFVRGLKGFGLRWRQIHKDFFAAMLNLLTIWPIVVAMIILTTNIGKLILGPDFELQQHEELKLITEHPQLSLRLLIIVTTVLAAPTLEEMLFRGLFQTMVRSILAEPWKAIVISSSLFALVHANPGHWPALFVLGMCLGYSYEKSGSILRPIFIHAMFNAASVIATIAAA